jgi:hypothetical protein
MIWLLGLGVLVVGSVLVFGAAVGLSRSAPDQSGISLPVGIYTGLALVSIGLVLEVLLIWRLIVEVESI